MSDMNNGKKILAKTIVNQFYLFIESEYRAEKSGNSNNKMWPFVLQSFNAIYNLVGHFFRYFFYFSIFALFLALNANFYRLYSKITF